MYQGKEIGLLKGRDALTLKCSADDEGHWLGEVAPKDSHFQIDQTRTLEVKKYYGILVCYAGIS